MSVCVCVYQAFTLDRETTPAIRLLSLPESCRKNGIASKVPGAVASCLASSFFLFHSLSLCEDEFFFYVQQESSSIRSCLHLLSTDSQFFSCLSRCTSFRALKHTSVKYPGNCARDDCGTQRLQSRPSSDCTGCGECAVCAQCCEWFSRGLNLACVVDIMIASLNPFYTDTRHPAKCRMQSVAGMWSDFYEQVKSFTNTFKWTLFGNVLQKKRHCRIKYLPQRYFI